MRRKEERNEPHYAPEPARKPDGFRRRAKARPLPGMAPLWGGPPMRRKDADHTRIWSAIEDALSCLPAGWHRDPHWTLRRLCDYLNAHEVPTFSERGRWTYQGVGYLLQHPDLPAHWRADRSGRGTYGNWLPPRLDYWLSRGLDEKGWLTPTTHRALNAWLALRDWVASEKDGPKRRTYLKMQAISLLAEWERWPSIKMRLEALPADVWQRQAAMRAAIKGAREVFDAKDEKEGQSE